MKPEPPKAVASVIDAYDPPVRKGVLRLRELIFEVGQDPRLGPIEEALRWGQPAYLAPFGSTLRLGPHNEASFAIYAHCQSTIIASYAQAYPGWDRIDGNRAVLFNRVKDIEPERLTHLIRHGLGYRLKGVGAKIRSGPVDRVDLQNSKSSQTIGN